MSNRVAESLGGEPVILCLDCGKRSSNENDAGKPCSPTGRQWSCLGIFTKIERVFTPCPAPDPSDLSYLGLSHEGQPIVRLGDELDSVVTLFRGVPGMENYWPVEDLEPVTRMVVERRIAAARKASSDV